MRCDHVAAAADTTRCCVLRANRSLAADVAYATKATVTKEYVPMGRKHTGVLHHRRSHVHIKLAQAAEDYRGWKARLTRPFAVNAPAGGQPSGRHKVHFDRMGQV